ncbi:hypothetical protein WS70_24450 [Burkholderia mayonis]|uniref:Uncharacterized protein n=1 Tax=Burkholderia mayonis TaxID=1385591 RepID=A0A1B4FMK5_9BURK|nr:hypothetical protein [Burkholderia mayonis]AOJ04905.1 hypothetical protein WS70_24450 [Burkholderia mayonis]KVE40808.1 hypothetical protein WS70_16095 [Burkholderia mayonis]
MYDDLSYRVEPGALPRCPDSRLPRRPHRDPIRDQRAGPGISIGKCKLSQQAGFDPIQICSIYRINRFIKSDPVAWNRIHSIKSPFFSNASFTYENMGKIYYHFHGDGSIQEIRNEAQIFCLIKYLSLHHASRIVTRPMTNN